MIGLLIIETVIVTLVVMIYLRGRAAQRACLLEQAESMNSRATVLRSQIHVVRRGSTLAQGVQRQPKPANRPVLQWRQPVAQPATGRQRLRRVTA